MLQQQILQLLLDLLAGLISLEPMPTRPVRQLSKPVMDTLQKAQAFRFDAVLLLAGTAPGGYSGIQRQPTAEIRADSGGGHLLELINQPLIQTAAMALISGGRAAETIAQHPVTPRQCRGDTSLDVLSPIGRIEQ